MKLVAVLGSPHGTEGTTGRLLSGVLDGAESADARAQTFLLGDMEVRPCRACDACHRTGQCAIGDDFGAIKDAMLEADAVVVASPNYIRSVSAQTKAMMDRCCGLLHMQALNAKYGAAVVTSGGEESQEVEDYILHFLRTTGCWTVGSVGAAARQIERESARAAALDEAKALGRRLVECAETNETFPDQVPLKNAFARRMKQLVLMHGEEWEYEYRHWQAAEE